jgi:membrane fusion protein (multidrug efflux system)
VVLDGLKAGEQVMVDGFQKLRPNVVGQARAVDARGAARGAAPRASAASR